MFIAIDTITGSLELSTQILTKDTIYQCNHCKEKVILKICTTRQSHFAHCANMSCSYSNNLLSTYPRTFFNTMPETEIHIQAKYKIIEILKSGSYICKTNGHTIIDNPTDTSIMMEFTYKKNGYNYRADIALVNDDKQPILIVEVKHTHATNTNRSTLWYEEKADAILLHSKDEPYVFNKIKQTTLPNVHLQHSSVFEIKALETMGREDIETSLTESLRYLCVCKVWLNDMLSGRHLLKIVDNFTKEYQNSAVDLYDDEEFEGKILKGYAMWILNMHNGPSKLTSLEDVNRRNIVSQHDEIYNILMRVNTKNLALYTDTFIKERIMKLIKRNICDCGKYIKGDFKMCYGCAMERPHHLCECGRAIFGKYTRCYNCNMAARYG